MQSRATFSLCGGNALLYTKDFGSHWKHFIQGPTRLGLVYWGLTPQQQPGSYQGGEMMMMKSVSAILTLLRGKSMVSNLEMLLDMASKRASGGRSSMNAGSNPLRRLPAFIIIVEFQFWAFPHRASSMMRSVIVAAWIQYQYIINHQYKINTLSIINTKSIHYQSSI